MGTGATEAPRRGRPRTIDQARIVSAAVDLGLDGFTMSGLASALGVSTPALYTHVSGRDEVLALVGASLRDRMRRFASPATTWRDWLVDFAELVRTHLAPSAATVLADLRAPGMADRVGVGEQGLRLLMADGFSATEAGDAVWLVFRLALTAGTPDEPSTTGFVRDATLLLDPGAPAAAGGATDDGLTATRAVHRSLVEDVAHDPFAFDLEVVLDGLARRRDRSSTPSRAGTRARSGARSRDRSDRP